MIFTSSPQCCQAIKTLPPLGSSDHVRIECSLHLQLSLVQGSVRLRRIWYFEKADFGKLNKTLADCDWSLVSNAATINDAWMAWKSIFLPPQQCGAIKLSPHRNRSCLGCQLNSANRSRGSTLLGVCSSGTPLQRRWKPSEKCATT